jgi:hypothetical protein
MSGQPEETSRDRRELSESLVKYRGFPCYPRVKSAGNTMAEALLLFLFLGLLWLSVVHFWHDSGVNRLLCCPES